MNTVSLNALLLLALVAPAGLATDLVVDEAGVAGSFTTLGQAMLAASPGDRILVMPGSYPAFHFSRGVEVHGMGVSPADVVVARVDFHVNIPNTGYDCALSNLTVCGNGPGDGISISGNELAPGTLWISGVETCGGVFLNGVSDFYLLVNGSRITPGVGNGFLGSAFYFGGGTLDLVSSEVRGWDADALLGTVAGHALRIAAGARVRVGAGLLAGGDGGPDEGGSVLLRNGATAVVQGFGPTPPSLRLVGGAQVDGGDAFGLGAGGHGVALQGTLLTGNALVRGGTGTPDGSAWATGTPTDLGYDPHVEALGARAPSGLARVLLPGEEVFLQVDPSIAGSALVFGRSLDPPAGDASPLVRRRLLGRDTIHLTCPMPLDGNVDPLRRSWVLIQTILPEPGGSGLVSSTPIVVLMAH